MSGIFKIKGGFRAHKKRRLIFYTLMMALPVIQFCIFYLGVNFNSFLLAFKQYDYYTGEYTFIGFVNFQKAFSDITKLPELTYAFKNSMVLAAFSILAGITLALLFSMYISKKAKLSGLFKVLLFLPQIVSSVIMAIMFKYFVERAIPDFAQKLFQVKIKGLLSYDNLKVGTLIFFTIWSGFGTQIMMFSGAMGGISESIIESAKIDGCPPVREFFSITLPMIYPTVVTFIIVGISQIFLNQMALYSFYGKEASFDVYTYGYFLYRKIQTATVSEYTYLSAVGLLLTFVSVPLTLITKFALEKLGASVN